MANLKALFLRMKSVRSIQKTTKVMQMISAAKLRQAQQRLYHAKRHMLEIKKVIDINVSDDKVCSDLHNKKDILLVIMSSDRGLCGSFNNMIVKFAKSYIEELESTGKNVKLLFFGKIAYSMMYNQYSSKILSVFSNIHSITDFLSFKLFLYRIGIDFDQFISVMMLFNKFYTTILQKPAVEQFIPYNIDVSLSLQEHYQYEPSYFNVLSTMSLGYILNLMYIAFLENCASEHSSRVIAMESANNNTKEMLNKLVLQYNRSRQAAITTDLIEVISGFESLGNQ
ncbi:F0F1 ATP synthase subunit gamma [Ehrlichia ruminantium]|uniref:ATP synthase gamma chain n=1 Tax=Ehrlichia ruminantium TaxID=779 RepID=A0AAE6UIH4_EHRRU|nr:ATP synthase F1 subunit gamma [Ehrlichia ruminantium]QGR02468.1 F0F1 ATP synthase subunit gamma [Ehrlichia ruminantium]QGR03387.1 F0F1 ATP synthase subunit gamma [Ehrlichia ruminantium]QGR04314.1 F0F1 ATP synthase subunit gamma [Ehrlichia ruminantium]